MGIEKSVKTILALLCGLVLVGGCKAGGGKGGLGYYKANRSHGEASFAAISSKVVREAALHYPKQEQEAVQQVPMSLTGSDGTGLKLVGLEGKAVVQGPLAFTELRMTFNNPQNRQREGRFSITLPSRAAISRFAMLINGKWQEAEVVERQRARQIYEDFLHRKQDPALLEKKAGNQFRARIFPIPANADKEIIVSFSQQLPSKDTPYTLFLKGLPTIASLKLTAFVGEQQTGKQGASSLGGVSVTHRVVKVDKQDWAPDQDFVVPTQSGIEGLRHGNLALARVAPRLSAGKAPLESLLVLVDTSASRAAGFQGQVELLGAVLSQMKQEYGPELPLQVACFDQLVGRVFEGPLGAWGQQDGQAILARRPLGASDLHGALTWARQQGRTSRVVLITDGIATAGKTEGAELRAAVKALDPAVKRLDVVLVGGIRDEGVMKQLVTGTLASDGVVLDGSLPSKELARRLSQKTVSGVRVSVPGAKWVWPPRLDGVQPGDSYLVFADLPQGSLSQGKPLTISLSGSVSQSQTVALAEVKRPLLERAWVEARIARLQHQGGAGDLDPDLRGAVRKQIIELSTKYRVLSDYTALLVLETEADYRRYNIQRNALADIMVVGASGVEVLSREKLKDIVRPRPRPRPRPPIVRPRPGPRPDEDRPRPVGKRQASGRAAPSMDDTASPVEQAQPRPASPPSRRMEAAKSSAAPRSRPRGRRDAAFEGDEVQGELRRPEAESVAREQRPMPQKKVKQGPPALTGKVAEVERLIKEGQVEQALVLALRWRAEQPGDVMALVALGMALEANGNMRLAARVYGSVIDLFPSRADMRRFAGNRLEALGKYGLELAADSYQQAANQRPDHPASHRLLAFARVQQGQHEKALAALEAGLKQRYRINRRGYQRILREDLGLVAAAWAAAEPNRRAELERRLKQNGATIADKPSLRFVLTWETDANDVDFHIHDGQGGHAYYSRKSLPTGGTLFADVTNGYGPECFAIHGAPDAYPYQLQAHYYSRGPMGYGMGKLQVIEHDGKGGLKFEERPFVVMNDRAYVDMGVVKGPL